jgi:NADH-quinone oxidoreductase subunit M
MDGVPLLSLIIFLPLLGALALYLVPGFGASGSDSGGSKHGGSANSAHHGHDEAAREPRSAKAARMFTLLVTLVTFAASLFILRGFDASSPNYQFVEKASWIPMYGVWYNLGVDGISLWLVMLTTFLMPIIVIASRSVHHQLRGYLASMLVLETAMLGTLLSLDLLLFYVFWELMLAPMYFIIGIWGGKRRIYATLKFVLYTVIGSVLMLVALVYVVWQHAQQNDGQITFLLSEVLSGTRLSFNEEFWLFAAFALAFGIKVPIFPFHTWLPDAHVEAPTGGSVVLAGILLKMGLYGFIRFAYPLFPNAAAWFAPYLAVLAVIGIIYGSLVAWAQSDIKKLVAYSSVAHLGFCVLGLVAFNMLATSGAVLQMINHGISTGALFLLVGVLYDRRHTREISEYGGLAAKIPVFAFLFLVFTLSSIALPLTNGFIGEFLILLGSFKTFPVLTAFATLGVILGAVYMLTLYLRTMFGEIDEKKNGQLSDVNRMELAALLPLFVLVFVLGLYPQPFLSRIEPSIAAWMTQVESRAQQLALSRDSHSSFARVLGQPASSSGQHEVSVQESVALVDSAS